MFLRVLPLSACGRYASAPSYAPAAHTAGNHFLVTVHPLSKARQGFHINSPRQLFQTVHPLSKARQGFHINSPRQRRGGKSLLSLLPPTFCQPFGLAKSWEKKSDTICSPGCRLQLQPGAIDMERRWRSRLKAKLLHFPQLKCIACFIKFAISGNKQSAFWGSRFVRINRMEVK